MKFVSSIFLLVTLKMFSAKLQWYGGFNGFDQVNNIANINNVANSQASALAVNAGVFGDANANAFSAATNINNVNQY